MLPFPAAAPVLGVRSALLFGASGQIGRALCARLLTDDWQVLAVSRVARAEVSPRLQWLQGELPQGMALPADGESLRQVDAIFSCGPLDRFSQWYAQSTIECPRVIAFGSTSASVKQVSPDPTERALSQLLAQSEARILGAASARGAAATLLRPTLVYGAGRDRTLTRIAGIARRLHGFVLPRGADGLRQPVHVEDLAQAACAVFDQPATHGRTYALPGGETLSYRDMIARTLHALQPPARLLEVPTPWFKLAIRAARYAGIMRGANDAVVARMREDLVFDLDPAYRDFGYAPRAFAPTAEMFSCAPGVADQD